MMCPSIVYYNLNSRRQKLSNNGVNGLNDHDIFVAIQFCRLHVMIKTFKMNPNPPSYCRCFAIVESCSIESSRHISESYANEVQQKQCKFAGFLENMLNHHR